VPRRFQCNNPHGHSPQKIIQRNKTRKGEEDGLVPFEEWADDESENWILPESQGTIQSFITTNRRE
jgi:hypothetical protein